MNNIQENPFLSRIIYENQLIENEAYGIVNDIEPITEGHYLFYSKEWIPAIADCELRSAVDFLENDFVGVISKPYAYFERGRASFCTSMNGVLHGHGHLIPRFLDNMESLFPFGKIESYSSLMEAYKAVKTSGQYLLWGNLGDKFYLIQNVEELPKRTIRRTVQKYTG